MGRINLPSQSVITITKPFLGHARLPVINLWSRPDLRQAAIMHALFCIVHKNELGAGSSYNIRNTNPPKLKAAHLKY